MSGDDNSESEKDIDLESNDKNIKLQLKDFIEDDLGDSDDEDDEDYDEINTSVYNRRDSFKTCLGSQDEFIYLRDILFHLNKTSPDYYNYLMSLIDENSRSELAIAIEKAEKRLSGKLIPESK